MQELSRYRSDFFGRLREVLGNRPGVRTVGDRFVFQSEVLFDSGAAAINGSGQRRNGFAGRRRSHDLEREIPPDMSVGACGSTAIQTKGRSSQPQFKSNWDLSASRAIAVVQYLVGKGVNPAHLVAAGFGEFQPIDAGDSDEALRRNRRIELKLTER